MDNIKAKFKEIYAKYFPLSYISLSRPALSDGSTSFMIVPLLGREKSEFSNGIEHNDPFRSVGSVYFENNAYEIKLPLHIGGLKPTVPHYAQSSVKVSTRKAICKTEEKLYETFDRYIKALRAEFDKQVAADNFLPLPFDVKTK